MLSSEKVNSFWSYFINGQYLRYFFAPILHKEKNRNRQGIGPTEKITKDNVFRRSIAKISRSSFFNFTPYIIFRFETTSIIAK